MVSTFIAPASRTNSVKGSQVSDSWSRPGSSFSRPLSNQRRTDASRPVQQGRQSPLGQRPSKLIGRTASESEFGRSRDNREMSLEELEYRRQEEQSLALEVQHLRSELQNEKLETERAVDHFRERIEHEQRESTRLQMVFMKMQLGESSKDEEVAAVKQDVIDKTNEILEAMREIREQQQQAFKQVKSLSYAMLKACSQPTPGATGSSAVGPGSSAGSDIGRGMVFVSGTRSPPRSPPSSVAGSRLSPGRHSPPGSMVGGRPRLPSEAGTRQRSPSLTTVPESDVSRRLRSQANRSPSPSEVGQSTRWFKQMQANLEQFGDVEVFMDDKKQECLCCNEQILSNYRVRPRKCHHVFHVECLLHWWSEGTCPVCHVSFAPQAAEAAADLAPEAMLTERSSSTHASRRDAAWRQGQHRRRRSPSNHDFARAITPPRSRDPDAPSMPRNASSEAGLSGLRASPSAEAFSKPMSPLHPAMPQSPVRRSPSQRSNAL